jgi:glycosyltransferase involved in cell wall biosynthesis
MSDPPRRVLMFAYFFPPLGGAGVQRTLKFAKYLPEHGWRPLVLTTTSRMYGVIDEDQAAQVPAEAKVIRARELPLPRYAAMAFGILHVPYRRFLASSLAAGWPDETAGWVPAAVWRGVRAVRRERPDVLYSTTPPSSTLLVGYLVARLTGKPWLVDFRDEWTHNPDDGVRSRFVQRLSRRFERAVARRADRVVVAAAHYTVGDGVEPGRQLTIMNGVDPDDVPAADGQPPGDRFTLASVGSLYGDRDASSVCAALAALAERGALDPARCELRQVGNVWLYRPLDAGAVPVATTGYVSHARAVEEMLGAAVLLLYVPRTSHGVPGKLFEYLATGRPILNVTARDNPAWGIVEELDAGICVEPEDQAGIEAAIETLYGRWQRGELGARADVRAGALERFSRRTLTGKLAEVLESVSGGAAPDAAQRPAEGERAASSA